MTHKFWVQWKTLKYFIKLDFKRTGELYIKSGFQAATFDGKRLSMHVYDTGEICDKNWLRAVDF